MQIREENTTLRLLTQNEARALERARSLSTRTLACLHRHGVRVDRAADRGLAAAVLWELTGRRRQWRPLALSTLRRYARFNTYARAALMARLDAGAGSRPRARLAADAEAGA